VALSVPTVVGRAGIIATHEIPLWPKEMQGLKNSAAALKPTVQQVMQRVGK
jgi:L-lactate dehydrogenase